MSERQSRVEAAVLVILRKYASCIPMYGGEQSDIGIAKKIAETVEQIIQEEKVEPETK